MSMRAVPWLVFVGLFTSAAVVNNDPRDVSNTSLKTLDDVMPAFPLPMPSISPRLIPTTSPNEDPLTFADSLRTPINLPSGLHDTSASPATIGSPMVINLTNHKNAVYTAEVAIGTPPQVFSVMFDTSASDSWILSSDCLAVSCAIRNTWHASDSFQLHSMPFHWTLGTAGIYGTSGQDIVRLGTSARQAGRLIKHTFAQVRTMDDAIDHKLKWLPVDGIFGLGFESASVLHGPNLLTALTLSTNPVPPVFSLYLSKAKLHPSARGNVFVDSEVSSVLLLGGMDSRLFVPPMTFFPLMSDTVQPPFSRWTINLTNVRVDGIASSSLCPAAGCSASFSTGQSLITIPQTHMDRLAPRLRLDPQHSCGPQPHLPTITLFFVAATGKIVPFVLLPEDYVVEVEAGGEGGKACFIAVVANAQDIRHEWTLGTVFLRKFVSVFDQEKGRIGLATSKGH